LLLLSFTTLQNQDGGRIVSFSFPSGDWGDVQVIVTELLELEVLEV
jgi:hypothetical protein